MVNLEQLFEGIVAEINAFPAAIQIRNKVFYGIDTSNQSKPYGRFQLVTGNVEGAYGASKDIDHCFIQADVFATSLSQANALIKAICDAIAYETFAITDQDMVHCIRRNFGMLVEGKETQNLVYHGFHVFEIIVDN